MPKADELVDENDKFSLTGTVFESILGAPSPSISIVINKKETHYHILDPRASAGKDYFSETYTRREPEPSEPELEVEDAELLEIIVERIAKANSDVAELRVRVSEAISRMDAKDAQARGS